MPNALMTYSGMTAKIKAMKGRLLSEEDYETVASMRSVQEFLSWLRTTPSYSKVFIRMPDALHRGEIEKLLQLALYDDYTKIYTFARPGQRRFIKTYFKRFEIQIIKAFLHLIFDHRDISFNTALIPRHFTDQSEVDLDQLALCRNLDDFFDVLKGSIYHTLLSPLKNMNGISLFDYELALDIYFFRYLWKAKDKTLNAGELKEITKIYGTQIDLLNILWIYRSKRFYKVENTQMYTNLIPLHYRLNIAFIKKLIESEGLEEYRELLGHSFYGRSLDAIEESAHMSDDALFIMYRSIMDKLHRTAARKNPYSIAVIDEYFYLREEEINRLTTAMECIRYGLDSSQIMKYIRR